MRKLTAEQMMIAVRNLEFDLEDLKAELAEDLVEVLKIHVIGMKVSATVKSDVIEVVIGADDVEEIIEILCDKSLRVRVVSREKGLYKDVLYAISSSVVLGE